MEITSKVLFECFLSFRSTSTGAIYYINDFHVMEIIRKIEMADKRRTIRFGVGINFDKTILNFYEVNVRHRDKYKRFKLFLEIKANIENDIQLGHILIKY